MRSFIVSGILFLIYAVLLSAKYISTSIYISKGDSLNSELFKSVMKSLPAEITIICIVSLVFGFIFFILGIKDYKRE